MTARLKGCLIFWISLTLLLSIFMPNLVSLVRHAAVTMATKSGYATTVPSSGTYSIAYVTCPNMEKAKTIASGLVKNKLAACVNIIPKVESVYEWEGEVKTDEEILLMIKTRTTRVNDMTEYVKINHPYDVAEVITSKIDQGNPAYLKWLGDVVESKEETF
ncbi:protein CutA homolog [Tubulanus polymorphus]|uniref:protein CutA homolog n=1 Tax=Tubulanus polymorphus TaxID=672921 RepID=UPI003DA46805